MHMSVDLRGMLRNGLYKNGGLQHDDGREMTPDEAFDAICDEIAKGRRVIPLGQCDNFDYQTGCLGHADQPPVSQP